MRKFLITKKSIAGIVLVSSAVGCETTRPKRPPTYGGGGAVSEGLHEQGGSAVLSFLTPATSQDHTHGFTANNPVRVGGGQEAGARNQQRYLNALLGPRAQVLSYERQGSCCPFKIKDANIDNEGQLDVYTITRKGRKTPLTRYLNRYEEGPAGLARGVAGGSAESPHETPMGHNPLSRGEGN